MAAANKTVWGIHTMDDPLFLNQKLIPVSDANWGCAAKRGETAHTQLLTEMAEHYHGFRNNDGQQVRAWVIDESSNDSLANGSGSKASVTWQTMNAGNSTPFNVMQPSLYLHHIIKI